MSRLGILLPLSCLPSHYGIGDMGDYAYTFLRILQRNHIRYWYINGLHEERSLTYEKSYYAGNPIYISLDELVSMKLLRRSELRHFHKFSVNVLYDDILHFKNMYYIKAFQRFQKWEQRKKQEYNQFCEQHWVRAYAKYGIDDLDEEEIAYRIFLQYIYDVQWRNLKQYANDLGIKLMVDLSFQKQGFDKDYVKLYQGEKKLYVYQTLLTYLCERYDIVYCKGKIDLVEYMYIKDALYNMIEKEKRILFDKDVNIFNFTKQQTSRWFCTSDYEKGSLMYQYCKLEYKDKVRMKRVLQTLETKNKKFSHKVILWGMKQKHEIFFVALWDVIHMKVKLHEDNITFRFTKVSQIKKVMEVLEELIMSTKDIL